MTCARQLLSRYTEVEKRFEQRSVDDVLCNARDQYKSDTNRVFEIALSHSRPGGKTRLIAYIVQRLADDGLVDQFVEEVRAAWSSASLIRLFVVLVARIGQSATKRLHGSSVARASSVDEVSAAVVQAAPSGHRKFHARSNRRTQERGIVIFFFWWKWSVVVTHGYQERIRRFNVLADQSPSIFDVLVSLFRHVNPSIRCAAMEVSDARFALFLVILCR